MSEIARTGDIVIGYCNGQGHDARREFVGVWNNGSDRASLDGADIVRQGDTGQTDCGHTFLAAEGSAELSADGMPVHRVGDTVIVIEGGVGVTQSGSPDGSAGV
jgi:uncharacterized Zn-binding protein involved in type VI secretion